MAKHNTIGNFGEELALKWVEKNEFAILETNWRYKRLEADIIASKNNTLHIIEVKTRTNTKFGHPEEGVTLKKIENMLILGQAYKEQNTQFRFCQFDILSITILANNQIEYFYIPDVYL